MNAFLISAGVFVIATASVYGLGAAWAQPRARLRRRLQEIRDPDALPLGEEKSGQQKVFESVDGAVVRALTLLGVEPRLIHSSGRFVTARIGLALLLPAAFLLAIVSGTRLSAMLGWPPLWGQAFAVLLSWFELRFVAQLWLALWGKNRETIIQDGLIDVLDLWTLCLGAGMSFQSAVVKVSHEPGMLHPVLQKELQLMNEEMLAGCPRDEALRRFSRRCGDGMELRALTAHIIQSEKLGTSLSQTLRSYAESLRFKRKQDAKERIYKLPAKMAIPLVLFILPALFIVILGPAALQLSRLF